MESYFQPTTLSLILTFKCSAKCDNCWLLSRDRKQTNYTFNDETLMKAVNDAVEAYREIYADEAKHMDMEKVKQTLNLNLSKQKIISDNFIITEDGDDGLRFES